MSSRLEEDIWPNVKLNNKVKHVYKFVGLFITIFLLCIEFSSTLYIRCEKRR